MLVKIKKQIQSQVVPICKGGRTSSTSVENPAERELCSVASGPLHTRSSTYTEKSLIGFNWPGRI